MGETTSARVAQWLVAQGFHEVAVLQAGLDAWIQQGYAVVRNPGSEETPLPASVSRESPISRDAAVTASHTLLETFLPHLAGAGALTPHTLPTKRDMVVLFVDMAKSTSLLYQHSVEDVLALIQAFMEEVTEIAVAYCGDVKDFEGDGALLYFDDVSEAVAAAFALREALLRKRQTYPEMPLPRLSLNLGPLVIGIIGSRFRQSIALVGSSLTIAARILKYVQPGGIIATAACVHAARSVRPDLASVFRPLNTPLSLEGIEEGPVSVYIADPIA